MPATPRAGTATPDAGTDSPQTRGRARPTGQSQSAVGGWARWSGGRAATLKFGPDSSACSARPDQPGQKDEPGQPRQRPTAPPLPLFRGDARTPTEPQAAEGVQGEGDGVGAPCPDSCYPSRSRRHRPRPATRDPSGATVHAETPRTRKNGRAQTRPPLASAAGVIPPPVVVRADSVGTRILGRAHRYLSRINVVTENYNSRCSSSATAQIREKNSIRRKRRGEGAAFRPPSG